MLTVTERLRKHGVVGKFVEFFGPGLAHLTLADRATLSNMCPEYGATVAIFPIDAMTIDYLRLTGRDDAARRAGRGVREGPGPVRRREQSPEADYNEVIELDLGTVEPSLAGPKRPQDRVPLAAAKAKFAAALPQMLAERKKPAAAPAAAAWPWPRRDDRSRRGGDGGHHELHQHVEPERAGRGGPAGEEGRRARPDAQAVGEDQPRAGLEGRDRVPGEGRPRGRTSTRSASTWWATAARPASATAARCPTRWRPQIEERGLIVASVLSGNRNFEGRVQPLVRANYLASPPLVVAYALAGTMTIDLTSEPLGTTGPVRRST